MWFLSRNRKGNGSSLPMRSRENEILFIDARNMGFLINRKNRDLSDEDINLIFGTYHNWRASTGSALPYQDVAGFCKVATIEEVAKLNYVLTPGRHVGLADEDDDFDFVVRFTSLKTELEKQIAEESNLNKKIAENLSKIKLTPTI